VFVSSSSLNFMCQLRGESALFLFPLFVKFIAHVFRAGLWITSEDKRGKV
jgi:hypothetical protein